MPRLWLENDKRKHTTFLTRNRADIATRYPRFALKQAGIGTEVYIGRDLHSVVMLEIT